jgi:hypothetical protein
MRLYRGRARRGSALHLTYLGSAAGQIVNRRKLTCCPNLSDRHAPPAVLLQPRRLGNFT